MSNRSRYALLAVLFVAGAAGVPLAVYLTLHFAPRKAQAWIIIAMLLVIGVTTAVSVGQLALRWSASRRKMPDSPEADYQDDPDRPPRAD